MCPDRTLKLDSRGHCSYDRKRKTTAGEQPSNSSGETISRGLGTTVCCLEHQQKQHTLEEKLSSNLTELTVAIR